MTKNELLQAKYLSAYSTIKILLKRKKKKEEPQPGPRLSAKYTNRRLLIQLSDIFAYIPHLHAYGIKAWFFFFFLFLLHTLYTNVRSDKISFRFSRPPIIFILYIDSVLDSHGGVMLVTCEYQKIFPIFTFLVKIQYQNGCYLFVMRGL